MPAEPIVLPADLELFQDSDPQTLIDIATAAVRRYCGWHVTPPLTETIILDGQGSGALMLPSLHVTEVALITENGLVVDDASYAVSVAGYVTRLTWWTGLDGFPVWLDRPYWWSNVPNSIEVTMTHGFESAPDLAAVITGLVLRVQQAPAGGYVRQVGQVAYQVPAGDGGLELLASERERLNLYKLPPRP